MKKLENLKLKGGDSYALLEKLAKSDSDISLTLSLDLTDVSFVTPIVSILAGVARERGSEIIDPSNVDARDYLRWALGEGCPASNDRRYIRLRHATDIDASTKIVNSFSELVGTWTDIKEEFSYALGELIDNIYHHAESKRGYWVAAQKYPRLGIIEIAVADLGIGIDMSLRKNPEYSSLPSMDCFRLAIEMGVTASPERNSGEGLSSILEWTKRNVSNGARAAILSNKNACFCDRRNTSRVFENKHLVWPGTFVWISIPKRRQVTLVDLWGEVGCY